MSLGELMRANWRWFAVPAILLLVLLGVLFFMTEGSSIAPFRYFAF
jgi:hypothetical protein